MIDSCLKLHGQLCPPEMLAFHATLEKFFRKNFADEILRLSVDPSPEPRALDAVPTSARLPPSAAMPSPNYSTLYVVYFDRRVTTYSRLSQENTTAQSWAYPRGLRCNITSFPSLPRERAVCRRSAMDETNPSAAKPGPSCQTRLQWRFIRTRRQRWQ